MTKDFYQKILEHLINTNQGFCFSSLGLISREDCKEQLKTI